MAGIGPFVAHAGFAYAAHQIISLTFGPDIDKFKLQSNYRSNQKYPFTFPEPQALIHAYYCGVMTQGNLSWSLRYNGINWIGDEYGPSGSYDSADRQRYWDYVIDSHRPHYDVDLTRRLRYLDPNFSPVDADYNLSREGFPRPEQQKQLLDNPQPLSFTDYVAVRQRGLMTEEKFRAKIKAHGVTNEEDSNFAVELLKEIPGPADLVHFVLRHGFEPSVIRANRLNEEFPQSARQWLTAQGLGYTFQIIDPFTGEQADTTWADMYWQTHWVPISPTQAYVMLQRIREDNIATWRQDFPDLNPFTRDDLNRWLRINDYPPGIRSYLAAISYNVPGRIDIRRGLASGTLKAEQLPAMFQDLGYSPKNSQLLADIAVDFEGQRKLKLIRKDTQRQIRQLFDNGIIDQNLARRQLYRLKIESPKELLAFDALPLADQDRLADGDPTISAAIYGWRLDRTTERVKKYTKILRRKVLTGHTDTLSAELKLRELGLAQDYIDELIQEWIFERESPIKDISKADILNLVKHGIITLEEALLRLVNLGYDETSSRQLLAQAQVALQLTAARDALTQARTAAERQKALIAQQKAADQAKRTAQQQLAKYGSPSKLVYWYQHGLIQLQEMERRLALLLPNRQDQIKWVDDALQKRQKQIAADAKAASKAGGASSPQQPISGGTAAPTSQPVSGTTVPASGGGA